MFCLWPFAQWASQVGPIKPNLKTKIVDGTSLAVAAVVHMIPPGTKDVLLLGDANKVATVLASALCEREIEVLEKHSL